MFGNRAEKPFRVAFVAFSVVGAVIDLKAAWAIADLLNGLMALPNLIAVLLLSGEVLSVLKAPDAEQKPIIRASKNTVRY